MIDTPKVSVIIPIYNVEPYLRECLDSVVNQTLRDIEIICVNDGSTDNSGAILAEYAALDERITVITQENGGLSAARNAGMDIAKGKYIYFIDSDDYIDLDALEVLYNRAEELEVDVLCFDFSRFDDQSREVVFRLPQRKYEEVRTGCALMAAMRDDGVYWVGVWVFFISRKLLEKRNLQFYKGIIYEDNLFIAQLLLQAHRTAHIQREFYHWRLRPQSILTTPPSAQNVESFVITVGEMLKYGLNCKGKEIAFEVWRTIIECQNQAKDVYRCIAEQDKGNTSFGTPFLEYIYRHFIVDTVIADDELFDLRQRLNQLQNDLNQQRSTAARLDAETVRLHNENSDLLVTINNLNSALTAANEKTFAAEQLVAAAWQEVENIHRSATYRIGRVITWVPRMARGFVRCYREHGWRYTWRRVVAHLWSNSVV